MGANILILKEHGELYRVPDFRNEWKVQNKSLV